MPRRAQPAPSARPEFLTLREAAVWLGISEKTARRWVADGSLPAYRLHSRQIRVRVTDVDNLLTRIPTA